MAQGSLTSRQDCEDLVRGCTIFGTGGGGDPELGLARLYAALEAGTKIGCVDLASVPDDAWTCTAFMMGSIAPLTEETKQEMRRFGLDPGTFSGTIGEAIKELGEYANVDISALGGTEYQLAISVDGGPVSLLDVTVGDGVEYENHDIVFMGSSGTGAIGAFDIDYFKAVPEPTTGVLLALGILALLPFRRR